MRSVLVDIADAFTREKGVEFSASYQSTVALMERIASGESADIAIITDIAIETLIAQGRVLRESRRDLASSGVGIAVRAGASRPDISTPDALKHALLSARSITYTVSGASGIHFAQVIDRLGIADAINTKAIVRDGLAGELAARDEVELAVQQISELMQVKGVDIVGPLPAEVQKSTVFSAAIFTSAKAPADAATLIAWLSRPATAAMIRAKGMEPLQV
jgi:molybdate transport system substrate-binding protein